MNAIATDEERVIQFKVWWKKNATWLLTVIIIAAAAFGGYKYFDNQKASKTQTASTLFTEFFGAHEEGRMDEAAQFAAQLQQEYPETPYANTVALILSHDAVQANDLAKASELLAVIANNASPFGKEIAAARIAQIKIEQQDFEGAVTLLNTTQSGDYSALFEEVKGDALVGLKRYSDAKTAYEQAIKGYTELGLETQLLQFKINSMPQS